MLQETRLLVASACLSDSPFQEDQQLRLIAGLFGDFEGDEDGGNLRDECEERLVLGGARRVSLGTTGRKGAMGGLTR